MKIIVLGAGDTGKFLAEHLSNQRHSITLIDESHTLMASLSDALDVGTISGSGAEANVLAEANVAEADLFIALTNHQDVNLVAASLAKAMGAKKSIARVELSLQYCQWLFDYRGHFNIDYLFSSEQLTATELSKYFLNPESSNSEQIGKGRIKVQQVVVSTDSELLGVPLRSLTLPPRVRLAVIHRGDETIIAKGTDELAADDEVTLFGEQSSVEKLANELKSDSGQSQTKKVTIYGGGDYGLALALLLEGKSYKTRIIEADAVRCAYLAQRLPDAVVLHGDGRSVTLLQEEQIETTDFFIGASSNDENNVMACLQAKNMGVSHVIPVIHSADNSAVIAQNVAQFGFLAAVSPRQVNLQDLMRFVESDDFHSVGNLASDVELVQFTVHHDAAVSGKAVKDVAWPQGSNLVTFLRNEKVIVPDGDDQILAGDSLYAVVLPQARKRLLKLLTR
ncbi:MAG: trk system potassium uptake protein TrkA [Verrucomicrobiales bacterium]|jgi:trk system potassium uptake protein TrkA